MHEEKKLVCLIEELNVGKLFNIASKNKKEVANNNALMAMSSCVTVEPLISLSTF